jgi:hypothetical protein
LYQELHLLSDSKNFSGKKFDKPRRREKSMICKNCLKFIDTMGVLLLRGIVENPLSQMIVENNNLNNKYAGLKVE